MSEKCDLCGRKLEETFLTKFSGTIVKIKKGDKNKTCYACPDCQRQHGNKLKEELAKK
jgi:hypothetical protein